MPAHNLQEPRGPGFGGAQAGDALVLFHIIETHFVFAKTPEFSAILSTKGESDFCERTLRLNSE